MTNQDYLMRWIERIGGVVARLLGMKHAGKLEETRQELDRACAGELGLSLESIRGLSPEAVAGLMEMHGGARHARSAALAELLLVDAALHDAANDSNLALASRVHAYCLLADSVDALTREEQAVYRPKLEALGDQLAGTRAAAVIQGWKQRGE